MLCACGGVLACIVHIHSVCGVGVCMCGGIDAVGECVWHGIVRVLYRQHVVEVCVCVLLVYVHTHSEYTY